MSVSAFLDANAASEKGNEHVSIAYKMIPHAQSSNAYVNSGSSGGEYSTVPPSTCEEMKREETSWRKGKIL